jgi:hypothetical protein
VTDSGHELAPLTEAAHTAMEAARTAGGHRWERAETLR